MSEHRMRNVIVGSATVAVVLVLLALLTTPVAETKLPPKIDPFLPPPPSEPPTTPPPVSPPTPTSQGTPVLGHPHVKRALDCAKPGAGRPWCRAPGSLVLRIPPGLVKETPSTPPPTSAGSVSPPHEKRHTKK